MAFPTTPLLDAFVRADEMPLNQANWQDVNGIAVSANQAVYNPEDGTNYASFYNTVFGPDCDAYITIATICTTEQSQGRIYARYDPDGMTGYAVEAEYIDGVNDEIWLMRIDAGIETTLNVYIVSLANGDKVGIRCDDDNISAYYYTSGAWALLGTEIDATYSGTGLTGIRTFNAFPTPGGIPLDDFGAGDETGAAFPEPGVIDNFNRANEGPPPSIAWIDESVLGIVSNKCAARQTPLGYHASALWRSSFLANQEIYVTVATRQDDGNSAYLYLRYQDYNNTILIEIMRDDGVNDAVEVHEIVAGVDASIGGPYVISYQDNDSFGINASGTTIEVWHKPVGGVWILLGTCITTLPLASGRIGLYTDDATLRFSDFGGGYNMPKTSPIDYSLIGPDGSLIDLTGSGLYISPGIPDGFGLPPVIHQTQALYRSDGAFLKSIDVQPRIITVSHVMTAESQEKLHEVRTILWNALRWNRTLERPPTPFRLRYTYNGVSADLYVHYLSDVTANVGNARNLQIAAVRLIAYDPMWYAVNATTKTLNFGSTMDVSYLVGKVNKQWDNLGNGGTGTVFAIAFSHDGDTVYIGGNFVNWAGVANADYIAKYTISTDTWSDLGGACNGAVYALAIGSGAGIGNTDVLYAGGDFTTIGGVAANRIAIYTGGAWSPLGVGVDDTVLGIACDNVGPISNPYVVGEFHNAGGAGASHIAYFNWVGSTWSTLGTGLDDNGRCVVMAPDGSVYVGGFFANANGVACASIAKWNGTTFEPLSSGTDGGVWAMDFDTAGRLYIGGFFATAGGVACANLAMWSGGGFSPLAGGVSYSGVVPPGYPIVFNLHADYAGRLYIGGFFDTVNGVFISATDRVTIWDGSSFTPLDIDFPGTAFVTSVASWADMLFVGFSDTGTITATTYTTIQTLGNCESFPVIKITGPGTLRYINNETSGEKLAFNLNVLEGEIITIDLSPGVKTITSSGTPAIPTPPGLPPRPIPLRRPMAGLALAQSDLGVWSLKPDPIAASGNNVINVWIQDNTADTVVTIAFYDRWLDGDSAVTP
jgi:hypothetical protein